MAHCRLCGTPNSDGTVYCAGERCGADQPGERATSGDLAVQAWFEPSSVIAPAGARIQADLVVRNAGRVPDRYQPGVLDDPHGRVRVLPHPDTTPLAPGQLRRWSVSWVVPGPGAAGRDAARVVLRVASRQDERVAAAAPLAVRVPGAAAGGALAGAALPGARRWPAVAAVVAACVAVSLAVGVAGTGTGPAGTAAGPALPLPSGTAVPAPSDGPRTAAPPAPGSAGGPARGGDRASWPGFGSPVVDLSGPGGAAPSPGAAEASPAGPSSAPVPGTPVPDLVGLSTAEARSRLTELGLPYEGGANAAGLLPQREGTVTGQVPAPGQTWRPGDPAVVLTVGPSLTAPPARGIVPRTAGLPYAEAAALVETAGLVPRREDVVDEVTPEGAVVRTTPEAGAAAGAGSTVVLAVSSASATASAAVEVPRVTGLDAAEAATRLRGAGLVAVADGPGDLTSSWTVTAQSPAGGRVGPGTPVRLTLEPARR